MAPTCEWDPAVPRWRDISSRSTRAVLYGLVPDGPGRWSGRLYNIDNGNSYVKRCTARDAQERLSPR